VALTGKRGVTLRPGMADETNIQDLKALLTAWFDWLDAKLDRILALLAAIKAPAAR